MKQRSSVEQPQYVRKFLEAITPEYYFIKKKSGAGTKSPGQAMRNEGEYSRFFDMLNLGALYNKDEIISHLTNLFLYGPEYFLAKLVNPILKEVLDVEKNKLKDSFINESLGQDAYSEILKNKTKERIALDIIRAIETLLSDPFKDYDIKEDPQLIYLSTIYYQNVTPAINSLCEQGIKLRDENKCYICEDMVRDIKGFISQNNIGFEELRFMQHDQQQTPKHINYLQNEITNFNWYILFLKGFDQLKKPSPELYQQAQQIIEKYKDPGYSESLQAQAQKSRSRGLATLILAVLAFTTFLALGLATLGFGVILIPAIPLIATLAVSAITGIIALLATVNYRLKYNSADQRIKEMEKQKIPLLQASEKPGLEEGSPKKIQKGLGYASLSPEELPSLEKQPAPEASRLEEDPAAAPISESDSQNKEAQSPRPQ